MQENYPEIDVDELARELNKLLPASFLLSRDELARLVRQCSLKRALSTVETGQLRQLQYELDGKPIHLSNAQIVFGSESNIGDMGIGDVVGRDKTDIDIVINVWGSATSDQFSPSTDNSSLRQKDLETVFAELIDERTRDFIGREYIFEEIDQVINSPLFTSGYIEITGEPGIGKTALLAQLIKMRKYAFYFNSVSREIVSTKKFIENICKQLDGKYELNGVSKEIPSETGEYSNFLFRVLESASRKSRTNNIVIAIDALDEANEAKSFTNRLALPPTLPQGVFIIVTTRPERSKQLNSETVNPISLRQNDSRNRIDVQRYIDWFLEKHNENMDPCLLRWSINRQDFIDVLLEASEGNFMYLKLVLPDIASGKFTKDNVSGGSFKLPKGLEGYYWQQWKRLQKEEPESFNSRDRRVICQIGIQPVSVTELAQVTKLPRHEIMIVIDKWFQYITSDRDSSGQLVYRLYHHSFYEFLREYIGLEEAYGDRADDALGQIGW
ncbi:MAG TPA: ATP-binding protein [Chloroflexaceae bacterium]|mgnify:CR=1 FL=1|nr:ATP-binding protein [Chloroflexaceae bacterium]